MEDTKEILAESIEMLTNGKFEVFSSKESGAISLQIIVDRSEYGKICGSKGKMIRAIKHIWEVCLARGLEVPIRVSLKEPSTGFAEGRNAEVSPDKFNADDFCELKEEMISLMCDVEVDYEKLSSGAVYTHKFFISMDDPPEYLGNEFKESFNILFHAMGKANGGYIKFDFNG